MTIYEKTLIKIIGVNNNLLKLKCSKEKKESNLKEIRFIEKELKEQIKSALYCKFLIKIS